MIGARAPLLFIKEISLMDRRDKRARPFIGVFSTKFLREPPPAGFVFFGSFFWQGTSDREDAFGYVLLGRETIRVFEF